MRLKNVQNYEIWQNPKSLFAGAFVQNHWIPAICKFYPASRKNWRAVCSMSSCVSSFDESRPNDGWLTVLRPTADDQTFGTAARWTRSLSDTNDGSPAESIR